MTGLSRLTARPLDLDAHLAQSIADILTTPVGTRVLRRDYGSRLPELIDAPLNGETLVDVFAETAEALDRWEPRLKLRRVEVTSARAGSLTLLLSGEVQGSAAAIDVAIGSEAA
ncbi:phage baseplate protein [Cereibacter sphaeroides]|uniref:GPW/gp25 family protein n=1 Tax=Cereibacter sphaeroides TaxID=1063 RepID=UPI000F539755|nr:GPW/gp25 family protein [Cereibacter sphaeroides]AZB57260.1 phage baseplate protein [Cereibacter sphaeroides]AZB61544.1 phage baseplate protein [Cereibacter sphaeroides]